MATSTVSLKYGRERQYVLPYVPSETNDGEIDHDVKIWTREAVCEIRCVD